MAFVDEIFKANSAILNTLLTLLNERLFDNGSSRVHVPLLCLVCSGPAVPWLLSTACPALLRLVHARAAVCRSTQPPSAPDLIP